MLSYSMFSRTGSRDRNEDAVLMCEQDGRFVFALADGLGGHGGGDVASASVTQTAIEVFKRIGDQEDYLSCALKNAQESLLQRKKSAGISTEMKSTMVLLRIDEENAQWAHIGDSRLYYFEGNHIVKRTMDHSVPQMLVNAGKLKESEIRRHVDRNKVLRVMGTLWEGASYEIAKPVEKQSEQAFLLCTDGFWELITEKEMEKTLKQSSSVAQWLKKMEKIVLKNGKGTDMDNYSAIAVYLE